MKKDKNKFYRWDQHGHMTMKYLVKEHSIQ